jgi:hypothetical protein
MSKKKNKDVEVNLVDTKRNQGNTQVEATRVEIGKNSLGEIVQNEKKFDVYVSNRLEFSAKSFDEAVEFLIREYNLNNN